MEEWVHYDRTGFAPAVVQVLHRFTAYMLFYLVGFVLQKGFQGWFICCRTLQLSGFWYVDNSGFIGDNYGYNV